MLIEVTELYDKLLRAAFFPSSLKMTAGERAMFGVWKESELAGGWLPMCVRNVR